MRRKLSVIVLVAFSLTMAGCTFNATSINQSEDKEAAEEIANEFYGYMSENKHEEAYKLFSHRFLAVTPKDSLLMMFKRTKEILGDFKGNELQSWESKEVSGTDSRTEYVLVYDIKYSKHKAIETISLLKEGDEGDIKILGYNVQSDGFLKWN